MAQFGDLCLASSTASFAISEAKWSRGAPWAAPLTRMLPRRVLAELLLTAQPISAQRAYEVGLVNEVVEPEQLVPRAWEVARTIADNAPLSVTASKWLIRVGGEAGVSATGALAVGDLPARLRQRGRHRGASSRSARAASRSGRTDDAAAVRIGGGLGYWGDDTTAPGRLVREADIDYLVMDFLAEVTMSIMRKQMRRDPDGGYATRHHPDPA